MTEKQVVNAYAGPFEARGEEPESTPCSVMGAQDVATGLREPIRRRFNATSLQSSGSVKPWLENKNRKRADRKLYWIFIACSLLGVCAVAILMAFTAINAIDKTGQKYCIVLDENFEGNALNNDIWFHEQQTGAWGTGEFEWTTDR